MSLALRRRDSLREKDPRDPGFISKILAAGRSGVFGPRRGAPADKRSVHAFSGIAVNDIRRTALMQGGSASATGGCRNRCGL
ncbi:hypothetical protein Nwi_2770 [Nitrobacter winogradskyi Nb-255]|uniref:Uncharacterized protein n=1 Tax=Nitrobacter winogradskyi (strain ATCC 25391 / DSM 10237 / CIP 104748 / NCIMB 11846 / Nb-255) TaxID=323098 RepID=Q3SNW8_NITWN|nr:hypothetical protein Nwi_2770 [Nitrobacter winogradskyi Nb-255]